jgi:hypothetical protein
MKIGLDYGGVISFSPDGWAKTIKKSIGNGHEIFLISHVNPGLIEHLQMRTDFAEKTGAVNLTFSDLEWQSQKKQVGQRKADLCIQHDIEIFIDDDLFMVQEVGRICSRCSSLYIPQNLWQVGQRLIDGLTEDW